MKTIREYVLYEGPAETYRKMLIPATTELDLPRNSRVLSVLTERAGASISIKAYIANNTGDDLIPKIIALVSDAVPDGSGWCFINSLVVATGPEAKPDNVPYHAYIKIC